MTFMDLLFKEYATPFVLLDEVISSGQFNEFIDTFEKQREERQLWEFYIHKLPYWDDRSFEKFKQDIQFGVLEHKEKIERPDDEHLETIVKDSFSMINNFNMKGVDEHGFIQVSW